MIRILLCHNYYSQRGGEDESFEDEARLLGSQGHALELLTERTTESAEGSGWQGSRLQAGLNCVWNRRFARKLRATIRAFGPDVVHFTNTFPLISPAAIRAASGEGVAVVQALRNYRLVCPAATLFRQGSDCSQCLGSRLAWPAIAHGCYRGRAASAVVAGSNALHGWLGTWPRHVDRFFTLSEVARRHLVRGGIPSERLVVKPNFVSDPGGRPAGDRRGAVFVGRLVPEKGVRLLLQAWRKLRSDLPLTLIGSGPMAAEVQAAAAADRRIHYRGELPQQETVEAMGRAQMVLVPSLWPEPFGRVVIEAFAVGTPVIASNRGALPELVTPGRTGALFAPDEPEQLIEPIEALLRDSSLAVLQKQCRQEYLERYAPPKHYERLLEIYRQAIEHRQFHRGQPQPPAASQPAASQPASGRGAALENHDSLTSDSASRDGRLVASSSPAPGRLR